MRLDENTAWYLVYKFVSASGCHKSYTCPTHTRCNNDVIITVYTFHVTQWFHHSLQNIYSTYQLLLKICTEYGNDTVTARALCKKSKWLDDWWLWENENSRDLRLRCVSDGNPLSLKRKCLHFDEIFITGCTESCQNDNFQCSQWWKFRQNDDIFVSVYCNSHTNTPFPSYVIPRGNTITTHFYYVS